MSGKACSPNLGLVSSIVPRKTTDKSKGQTRPSDERQPLDILPIHLIPYAPIHTPLMNSHPQALAAHGLPHSFSLASQLVINPAPHEEGSNNGSRSRSSLTIAPSAGCFFWPNTPGTATTALMKNRQPMITKAKIHWNAMTLVPI